MMVQRLHTSRLTDFFKSEYGKLVGFVRRKVDTVAAQDAEDFVQEVAINLFQRADISAPIENLSAYVYRALRNEIVDYFRKKREVLSLDQSLDNYEEIKLIDIVKDKQKLASSELEKKELAQELYRLLDILSDEERALIIATEIEGHTFKELTEKWQIPINTLLSRKSRAMKKLLHGSQEKTHKTEKNHANKTK